MNSPATSQKKILSVVEYLVKALGVKGLVTNYWEGGGYETGGGGHVKFYPYEKGGRKKFKPC